MTETSTSSRPSIKLAFFVAFSAFLPVLIAVDLVRADAEATDSAALGPDGQPVDQSSPNFKKARKFLPGEEVVTPTGKTVKVWSTEGPVSVSRAPEPFEDKTKTRVDGINVVVDSDRFPGQRPVVPLPRGPNDTFDTRPRR